MELRELGATGIQLSAIGYGTWAIGGEAGGAVAYGATDDEESLAALLEAQRQGCTFFDTSPLYGWGHAEELLGEAFAHCRESVVIATKAGYTHVDGRQEFTPSAIRGSLERSLGRLRTDYVDLLQLHNPPPEQLETNTALFRCLDDLQGEGLIRAAGISARTPDEALVFARRHAPAFLQVNFNLGDLRALRNGLFALCQQARIGLIARTPLAAGFLTGRIDPASTFAPTDHRRRFSLDVRRRWVEAVKRLEPVFSDAPTATPAQQAIRFCLSFPSITSVIPGMMRREEVLEDLGTAPLPRLSAHQLREVDAVYDRVFS